MGGSPQSLWRFLANKPNLNVVKARGPTSTYRKYEEQGHKLNDATRASRRGKSVQNRGPGFSPQVANLKKMGDWGEVAEALD